MYRYEVRFKYNTDNNGGCTSKTAIVIYPKRINAFSDAYGSDGKGNNEILSKAVNELGLDAGRVEAIADRNKLDGGWYNLRYLGEVKSNNDSDSTSKNIAQNEEDYHASTVAANKERREAKEAELERKAASEERQRLIDIEEAKVRAEKDAHEKAKRQQRADELRSQGKNFQAFIVEFQNGVIALSVALGLALFLLFIIQSEESNKSEAMKINSELEQIEDSVKIYIKNKNYDKALFLANKLVHSSSADMEHLEFDAWNGYPKFDEYWTKKRDEYKKIILNNGSINSDENVAKKIEVEKSEDTNQEESKINPRQSDSLIDPEGLDNEYLN
jgi:hypothetical protein